MSCGAVATISRVSVAIELVLVGDEQQLQALGPRGLCRQEAILPVDQLGIHPARAQELREAHRHLAQDAGRFSIFRK